MGAQNVMTSASIRFVFWLIPAKTTVRYRRSVHVESIKVSHVPCSEGGETYRFTFVSEKTELAKEGIPMPFGNRFWASNWPTGKSPFPGLIVHLIPSVRFGMLRYIRRHHTYMELPKVIVILAPPPNVAYPFILDIEGYPQQVINLLVVCVRLYCVTYG